MILDRWLRVNEIGANLLPVRWGSQRDVRRIFTNNSANLISVIPA
jgi:hypothetical protein